jgi:hypothetical protein
MLNVSTEINLGGTTEIHPGDCTGFYLYQSINDGLPYGYIDLLDRSSVMINNFENMEIGSNVYITLRNVQNDEEFLKYPVFYLLKIENDFELDPFKFAGTIRLWFGHPWFLFKDSTNHAYNPMNHGKLIQKILEDKTRGIAFEVNKDKKLFAISDDSGEYSRYKTCETDWEFIQDKLLPYTSIAQLPPLFFCHMYKKKEESVYKFAFNLTNSTNLYEQKSKIIITPTQEALVEGNNAKLIEQICIKNNIEPDVDIYFFQSLSLMISYEDSIGLINPVVSTENISNGKFIRLDCDLSSASYPSEGSNFSNLLPLNNMFVETTNSTWAGTIKNRLLIDAVTLMYSCGKELESTFSLVVNLNYCGDKVTIGDTVELFVPPITEEGSDSGKVSWLNGKWVVNTIKDFSSGEEPPTRASSEVILTRPAFIGDKNTTSLSKIQTLFEA